MHLQVRNFDFKNELNYVYISVVNIVRQVTVFVLEHYIVYCQFTFDFHILLKM